jgi:hypothetical protein
MYRKALESDQLEELDKTGRWKKLAQDSLQLQTMLLSALIYRSLIIPESTDWLIKKNSIVKVYFNIVPIHASTSRHLWPVWLPQIFRQYLINVTIFGGGGALLNIKCFYFFYKFCLKRFSF